MEESGKSLLEHFAGSPSLPAEFQGSVGTSTSAASALWATPPSLGTNPALDDGATRRSSRAIKRKRFDDEIVETSPVFAGLGSAAGLLAVSGGGGAGAGSMSASSPSPTAPTGANHHAAHLLHLQMPSSGCGVPSSGGIASPGAPSPASVSSSAPATPQTPAAAAAMHAGSSSKGGKGISAKGGRNRADLEPSLANSRAALCSDFKSSHKKASNKKKKKSDKKSAMKDLGRWKPTDDLALVTAVQQTNNLCEVYRGIKFSCHFTMTEIQERWFALMYNPLISKLAIQAIRNLHPEVALGVKKATLFSKAEQDVLNAIRSNTHPSLKEFDDLLKKHSAVFHLGRTSKGLKHQWERMKQFTLLPDQSVQPLPKDNHILNFFDAENFINDGELVEAKDSHLNYELSTSDRRCKKEIRHLEEEVKKWQVLVDKVSGTMQPEFDSQTLAVLRGRLVRYLMRSKEISLGRTTLESTVDVDLKLEGPAWKISRRQGFIKLRNSGQFFIANEGKRAIFVDGKPIQRGFKSRLENNSVLEIAGLKFVFLINQDLIEAIRQEAAKIYQNS